MSIESKHAYRFGYLKSEQWSNVRLEALVREKGKCQICFDESIYNDAHHIWYPANVYETKIENLVILCRSCHDFLHLVIDKAKTNNEELGKAQWLKFSQAMTVWRMQKHFLFEDGQTIDLSIFAEGHTKDLRERLIQMKIMLKDALSDRPIEMNKSDQKHFGVSVKTKNPIKDVDQVCALIRKWAKSQESASCVSLNLAETDFEI